MWQNALYAVVGILSVEKISGYSKAIEMLKVKKYRYLFFGMLDYLDDIKKADMPTDGFTDVLKALEKRSENWKDYKDSFLINR